MEIISIRRKQRGIRPEELKNAKLLMVCKKPALHLNHCVGTGLVPVLSPRRTATRAVPTLTPIPISNCNFEFLIYEDN